MAESRVGIGSSGIDPGRKLGMMTGCLPRPNPKACLMRTASPVFVRRRVFVACSVIRRRGLSRLLGAQKNGMWNLWAGAFGVLRPHHTARARSGQAGPISAEDFARLAAHPQFTV